MKNHVARTLQKLGPRDRVQVVINAFQTGMITPGQRRPSPCVQPGQSSFDRIDLSYSIFQSHSMFSRRA
jgi:hypothetical protein